MKKNHDQKQRVRIWGKSLSILTILLILLSGCSAKAEEGTEILLEEMSEPVQSETAEDKPDEITGKTSEKSDPGETAECLVRDEQSQRNAQETSCYVYICGAVCHPGVYQLPPESRVYQVIEMAGGFLPQASKDFVNQAQSVSDGVKIWIPTEEEVKNGQAVQMSGETQGATQTSGSGKVNINTAGESELCSLSGIGASRAKAIISYREEHGRFQKPEDIMKISGIKKSSYEKIKDNIVVS